jgi:hypothetical protein
MVDLASRLVYIEAIAITSSTLRLSTMNAAKLRQKRQDILDDIARIPRLKRGKLSERKRRSKTSGEPIASQFIFQCWKDGRNASQHVCAEDLPGVREAVSGYERFKQLAEAFVGVSETLTEMEAPVLNLKKTPLPKLPAASASRKRESSSK